VKYLLWYLGVDDSQNAKNANGDNCVIMKDMKLLFDGHDQMESLDATYYNLIEPYLSGVGGTPQISESTYNTTEVPIHYTDLVGTATGQKIQTDEGLKRIYSLNSDRGVFPYLYSFSLNPDKPQPSGTCNFSKIKDAEMHITYQGTADYTAVASTQPTLVLYAVNYNVLKIQSGMAAVIFF
jgi:ABC-type Fe3+-hydroxamate transport system substrate-binding protein